MDVKKKFYRGVLVSILSVFPLSVVLASGKAGESDKVAKELKEASPAPPSPGGGRRIAVLRQKHGVRGTSASSPQSQTNKGIDVLAALAAKGYGQNIQTLERISEEAIEAISAPSVMSRSSAGPAERSPLPEGSVLELPPAQSLTAAFPRRPPPRQLLHAQSSPSLLSEGRRGSVPLTRESAKPPSTTPSPKQRNFSLKRDDSATHLLEERARAAAVPVSPFVPSFITEDNVGQLKQMKGFAKMPGCPDQPLLHWACAIANLAAAQDRLAQGDSINAVDDPEVMKIPLHYAVAGLSEATEPVHKTQFLDLIKYLLVERDDCQANACDAKNVTPLHQLVLWDGGTLGDGAVMEQEKQDKLLVTMGWFMNRGAKIDGEDDDGRTPLKIAITIGNWAAVKALVALGAKTSFLLSHVVGRADTIDLLKSLGLDPNGPDEEGKTLLYYAAKDEHIAAFKALLKVDTNPFVRVNGVPPLFYLGGWRDVAEAVRIIYGSLSNISNDILARVKIEISEPEVEPGNNLRNGTTLVHLATHLGDAELLEYILSRAPSLRNRTDSLGRTSLHCFVSSRNPDASDGPLWNCFKGARKDIPDAEGRTPLHTAAYKEDTTAITLLLGRGANIEARDKYGRTPFLLAATTAGIFSAKKMHQNPALIMLYACRANIFAVDAEGNSALHYTVQAGCGAACKRLVEWGLSPRAQNKAGQTPLTLVQDGGDLGSILAEYDKPDAREQWLVVQKEHFEKMLDRLSLYDEDKIMTFQTAIDSSGETLLSHAIRTRTLEQVTFLTNELGVEIFPDATDCFGTPLLHLALGTNDAEQKIKHLHRCGASLTKQDATGNTILHRIMAEHTIKQGLNIYNYIGEEVQKFSEQRRSTFLNAQNENGETALCLGVKRGSPYRVHLLEATEADPNTADSEGNTPLHYACERSPECALRLLHIPGIQAARRNHQGETPFKIAKKKGEAFHGVRMKLIDRGAHKEEPAASMGLMSP